MDLLVIGFIKRIKRITKMKYDKSRAGSFFMGDNDEYRFDYWFGRIDW